MKALKEIFLGYRTISSLKIKTEKPYTYFADARNIGVLFTVEDKQKHELVKAFVRQLEQQGKKVQTLTFLPEKKENYDFLFDYVTEKDFSLTGKINSQTAIDFSRTNFDFLFYFDLNSNKYAANILSTSNAKCRAGRYHENSKGMLEFMLKAEDNIDMQTLINQLYYYITLAKSTNA
jgi:hypothetical protein